MRPFRGITLLLCLLTIASAANAQAERWWADVKALAHDSMAGRETGSAEHRKAAEFVAAAFRDAGLKPGGTQGFIQPVPFVVRSLDESQSSLAVVRFGREEKLVLGQDASFVLRAPLANSVEAPVVFAGYGLDLPEYGHDDLSGLDLKGKVVAYLAGAPRGIPGPVLSHARNQAWPTFRAAGAVGMIAFSAARGGDTAFIRGARNRLNPQMALGEPALDAQNGNKVSLLFNAARAEKLFAGAPERFAVLAAKADSGLPLPRFALHLSVRSTARLSERRIESQNIIGVLPGTDPVLRDEYVVLTAHVDHIGIGRPVNGDSINNGAMDNASGTALLMDAARQLPRTPGPRARSVLFVVVTGEEHGLLGSRWYANHPTVPPGAIMADINTDMFLPINPFRMLLVNGLEESNLADDARQVGEAQGVQVITDPEPEENRFVRSDQYSFILRGIPSISLKVGYGRDTPEHERVREFRAKRYHQPSDDLDQPVDMQSAADFERLYIALVNAVANRATRPVWLGDSYFRRFARVQP
jgi:hypothetical protein